MVDMQSQLSVESLMRKAIMSVALLKFGILSLMNLSQTLLSTHQLTFQTQLLFYLPILKLKRFLCQEVMEEIFAYGTLRLDS
jgi:hypothetical protein